MDVERGKLYQICFNERNIGIISGIICKQIKLSERSIPKLIKMIQECMRKNIRKVAKEPKTVDEIKEVVKNLNRMCVEEVIGTISRKYPHAFTGPNNVSKTPFKRDIDMYGKRDVRIQERPYIRSKKDYDKMSINPHRDEQSRYVSKQSVPQEENMLDMMYSMNLQDSNSTSSLGYSSTDFGGYASPFDNHSITNDANLTTVSTSQDRFLPDSNSKDDYSKRYEMMKLEREQFMSSQVPKIPDIDLSLDDPEIKARRRMAQEQSSRNIDGTSSSVNTPDNSSGIDNYYASILGDGAPKMNESVATNMTGLGAGNPVMAGSSHSISDNRSNSGNTDYEKMLQARMRDDEINGFVKPQQIHPQHNLFSQPVMSKSNNIFAGI